MAPGTRTPNERNLIDVDAGLPRDLETGLTVKTVAKLRAVFWPAGNYRNHAQTPKPRAPEPGI
jgi:hypothetical protein